MTYRIERTLRRLGQQLPGRLSLPGDDRDIAASAIWAKPAGGMPRAVAHCRTPEDVQSTIRAARSCDLPLSVRPLSEFHPDDPERFQTDTLSPYFERLRNEQPVHLCSTSPVGAYCRHQHAKVSIGEEEHEMKYELTPPARAMEAGGAYNKNAKLPACGGAFAISQLENAARSIAFGSDSQPIVIADYGSSQGRNSLSPMRVAIEVVRARLGSERPIFVFHEDLPENDFNSLFEVLNRDPQSYALHAPNVFPCAIGRSFYKSVLPPNHVHLGWCSYAAMWISRIPTTIPGHFFVPSSTGAVREAFDQQGAQDWETFLSLRARELRAGGRLVVTVPAAHDDGTSGGEYIVDQANSTLAEMVDEGAITAEERARMAVGAWPRRRRDLLAPFARGGHFHDLKVEHCETNALADPAWADYELDCNKEALASKHAAFFRAVFAPTLAGALARDSEAERLRAFSDRLESGLKRRLASQPQAINSLAETIVLAKTGVS